MPGERVRQCLDEARIRYIIIRHSPEFTAQEIAATTHIRGKELAKTVMVKIDGSMAMAEITASSKVDLERLREAVGAESAELATEEEFGGLFPECEVGAMPPFGQLYDMPVFVDALLREDEEIAFNAGSHIDLIQMSYTDYERVVSPAIVRIRA
ncbi:MAG: YbaK/EbsC family protein [Gemmatimonadetes bacterium]|nr:YbaK/EbsC family protein [Gemmatimonadota bacterium]